MPEERGKADLSHLFSASWTLFCQGKDSQKSILTANVSRNSYGTNIDWFDFMKPLPCKLQNIGGGGAHTYHDKWLITDILQFAGRGWVSHFTIHEHILINDQIPEGFWQFQKESEGKNLTILK